MRRLDVVGGRGFLEAQFLQSPEGVHDLGQLPHVGFGHGVGRGEARLVGRCGLRETGEEQEYGIQSGESRYWTGGVVSSNHF